jgi:hypothetical protein
MKIIKYIITFFIILLTSFTVFAESEYISIIDINSENTNLLKVFLDKKIETNSDIIESDIRVFRNLDNKKISIDLENNKLVHLSLENTLESNTSYSLLSVY